MIDLTDASVPALSIILAVSDGESVVYYAGEWLSALGTAVVLYWSLFPKFPRPSILMSKRLFFHIMTVNCVRSTCLAAAAAVVVA